MKRIIRLSYIYSVLSVFIGPLAVGLALGRNPSGGDCSDPSWGSTPISQRIAIYHSDAVLMNVVAIVMAILGIALLIALLYITDRNKALKRSIIPALFVLLMLAGYGLIIYVASTPWC
jgi:hypothetical protein